jgi:hypothetical protein
MNPTVLQVDLEGTLWNTKRCLPSRELPLIVTRWIKSCLPHAKALRYTEPQASLYVFHTRRRSGQPSNQDLSGSIKGLSSDVAVGRFDGAS